MPSGLLGYRNAIALLQQVVTTTRNSVMTLPTDRSSSGVHQVWRRSSAKDEYTGFGVARTPDVGAFGLDHWA